METHRTMKHHLTRLVVRNFRYKLFALIMGVAIWYTLTLRSFEDVLVGPVEPRFNMPANFQVDQDSLERIFFTLNCPAYVRSDYQLGADQFAINVVLGPKTVDEKQLMNAENYTMDVMVQLHRGLILNSLPPRVANLIYIDSIRPNQLPIKVSLVTRKVPVVARVRGNPQEGFVVGRPELLSLQEVELTGSFESLQQLEYLSLHPVDVSGLTRDVTRQVEIDLAELSEKNIKPVREADRKVYVRIPVERAAKPMKLTGIPVQVRGVSAKATVTVTPDLLDLEVEGRPSVLRVIDASQVSAEIDLTGFGPGVYEIPAELRGLPSEVQIKEKTSSLIEVKIESNGPAEKPIEDDLTR